MNWDKTKGYRSYNPAYLANVDDMLHRMAQSGSGSSGWGCVDNTIIHPWLKNLFATAKAAAPNFLYTISGSGGLLDDGAHWLQKRENL